MRRRDLLRSEDGASALEFALTAPVFLLFVFGVIEIGILMWTQVALQHGVETAARCATVNKTLCPTGNPGAIVAYASDQTLGLNVPSSAFTFSNAVCGHQVQANYVFSFPSILNLPPLTLKATSCFPT